MNHASIFIYISTVDKELSKEQKGQKNNDCRTENLTHVKIEMSKGSEACTC